MKRDTGKRKFQDERVEHDKLMTSGLKCSSCHCSPCLFIVWGFLNVAVLGSKQILLLPLHSVKLFAGFLISDTLLVLQLAVLLYFLSHRGSVWQR